MAVGNPHYGRYFHSVLTHESFARATTGRAGDTAISIPEPCQPALLTHKAALSESLIARCFHLTLSRCCKQGSKTDSPLATLANKFYHVVFQLPPHHQVSSVAKEEALGQTRPFLGLGAIALAWQTHKGVVCNRGGLDCHKGNTMTGRKFFLHRKWRTWLVGSSLYTGSTEASGSADPVGKTSEGGGCRVPGREPHKHMQ